MSKKYLIVGLGNPGMEYEYSRHNLGFLVVKQFAQDNGMTFEASSLTQGWTAEKTLGDQKVILLLPSTYMNNSGVAVRSIVEKEHVDLNHVLVVTDDFNLEFSQVRIRQKGSDGGHNGLSSVIQHLKADGFARVRLGIDSPKNSDETVDFVLSEFTKKEKKELAPFISRAVQCCQTWLRDGVEKAMNQFNRRNENE